MWDVSFFSLEVKTILTQSQPWKGVFGMTWQLVMFRDFKGRRKKKKKKQHKTSRIKILLALSNKIFPHESIKQRGYRFKH